jgi:HSP20 family protein
MSEPNRTIPVAINQPAPQAAEPPHAPEQAASESRLYQTPSIDIHEGPDGLVLEADLPGATENDVSIQLEDNVLILHAKVSSSVPEKSRLLHEEYRAVDYYRSFILSDDVERSRITAELKNGVLRLVLPRAERAKTRRIEIKS